MTTTWSDTPRAAWKSAPGSASRARPLRRALPFRLTGLECSLLFAFLFAVVSDVIHAISI